MQHGVHAALKHQDGRPVVETVKPLISVEYLNPYMMQQLLPCTCCQAIFHSKEDAGVFFTIAEICKLLVSTLFCIRDRHYDVDAGVKMMYQSKVSLHRFQPSTLSTWFA